MTKLKQLTIVSYAAHQKVRSCFDRGACIRPGTKTWLSQRQILSYRQLMADLDVSNVRELEDMIIECIYADLIAAKLDQKAMSVEVQHAIARDVQSSDISAMTATIDAWYASCCILASASVTIFPMRM